MDTTFQDYWLHGVLIWKIIWIPFTIGFILLLITKNMNDTETSETPVVPETPVAPETPEVKE